MKKSLVLRALISIIIFLLVLAGGVILVKVQKNETIEKNNIKSTTKLTYEVKAWHRKTAEVLIKITDNENGIEKIEYVNDNHIENCYGAKIKARDCILQYGVEYKVKIKLKDGNEKLETVLISETDADIYVATTGDDTTGDGTVEKPYATLAKAINVASDGNKIYIFPGEYIIIPSYHSIGNIGNVCSGIDDEGKKLEIFGANENTIIIYEGDTALNRWGTELGGNVSSPIRLANSESILRNVTCVFKPRTDTDYFHRKAIFGCTAGKISNVFFRIVGDAKAAYYYGLTNSMNVDNCTFFHDLGDTETSSSGTQTYNNIATNSSTGMLGTLTNIQVQRFGTVDNTLAELIQNSKTNQTFIENQAGVYYGENAWK